MSRILRIEIDLESPAFSDVFSEIEDFSQIYIAINRSTLSRDGAVLVSGSQVGTWKVVIDHCAEKLAQEADQWDRREMDPREWDDVPCKS